LSVGAGEIVGGAPGFYVAIGGDEDLVLSNSGYNASSSSVRVPRSILWPGGWFGRFCLQKNNVAACDSVYGGHYLDGCFNQGR
jgi:hypothetical protein